MGGVAWTLFWVAALAALVSSTVTRSKRKIKTNSDDTETLETSTSQSTDAVSDDVEVEARPKRKKEVVESSKTTDKRRSGASSGPHECRFCGLQFAQSQALGGHMNKHRADKEHEELRKAQNLVAQRQQLYYPVNHPPHYNMQGGGGGGHPYYASYVDPSHTMGQYYGPTQSAANLQNPSVPVNQSLATPQQNAQMGILQQQGGPSAGAYYSPTDNKRQYNYSMPAQRAVNPPQQFYTPEQTSYVDSKSLMHSGVDQCGQSIFHSNVRGGTSTGPHLQDFSNFQSNSMPGNNPQVQSNIAMPPESYILRKSAEQEQITSSDAIQFVDQHGNPALDNLPGHPISFPARRESHEREGFPMHGALNKRPDFPDGADQTTILIDCGQTSFETDTSEVEASKK